MLQITPVHVESSRYYDKRLTLLSRLKNFVLHRMLSMGLLANSAQTISGSPFQGFDVGFNTVTVYFTVTPSGNYVLGGDTLDFTQLKDIIKSSYVPLQVYLQSQAPGGASGWWYSYRPGTTQANGKMQVFGTGASAGTSHQELGNGVAYSAQSPSITADVIVGSAIFVRV